MTAVLKKNLSRQPLANRENSPALADFANSCQQQLGYKATSVSTLTLAVQQAFRSLAFAPLKREAVERWKRRCLNDWSGWLAAVGVPGIVGCFLTLLAAGISLKDGSALVLATGLGALTSVCGIAFLIIYAVHDETRGRKEWQRNDLNNYRKIVPRFAVQTALEIDRELINTLSMGHPNYQKAWSFHVEELANVKRVDPFLILTADGIDYYLEVWDEEGFEVERDI